MSSHSPFSRSSNPFIPFLLGCLVVIVLGFGAFRALRSGGIELELVKTLVFLFNFSGFCIVGFFTFGRLAAPPKRTDDRYSPQPRNEYGGPIGNLTTQRLALPEFTKPNDEKTELVLTTQSEEEEQNDSPEEPVKPSTEDSFKRPNQMYQQEDFVALPENSKKELKTDSTEVDEKQLRTLLDELVSQISVLVDSSNQLLSRFDSRKIKSGHQETSTTIKSIILAKRIVLGLENRIVHITSYLDSDPLVDLEKGVRLLTTELVIPKDSLGQQLGESPELSIKPNEWEPTLSQLFHRITRSNAFEETIEGQIS